MIEFIARKPWLLIIAGFFLLAGIWAFFFVVAVQNQPEKIPLGHSMPHESKPVRQT